MSTDSYLLTGKARELQRLQRGSRMLEPAGRRLLGEIGDGQGARALDVGCGALGWLRLLSDWVGPDGQVVGTDIQDEMLAAAQQFVTAEGLGNVTLVHDDLFASQLEPASFDLVHARALIFPLGRGPEQMASHLRLVRPSGTIALEEVDTASLHHLPSAPAFDQLKPQVIEAFRKAGGDPDAAATQLALFRSAGIQPNVPGRDPGTASGAPHPAGAAPVPHRAGRSAAVADRPRRAGTAPRTGRARTPGPRPLGPRRHPCPVLGPASHLATVLPLRHHRPVLPRAALPGY